MVIEFEIPVRNLAEKKLATDFRRDVVSMIRNDILMRLRLSKMNMREEYLLNASWIHWYKKPKKINMYRLVKLIIKSIEIKKRKNTYIIQVNPYRDMPGSSTKLSTVARFLDRGNELIAGTSFMSNTFNKYRKKMNVYWRNYVFIRTGTIPSSEVVIIR